MKLAERAMTLTLIEEWWSNFLLFVMINLLNKIRRVKHCKITERQNIKDLYIKSCYMSCDAINHVFIIQTNSIGNCYWFYTTWMLYILIELLCKLYIFYEQHSSICLFYFSSSRTHSRITRYPCGPRECYQPYMYHILQSWATCVCFLVQRWIGKYIQSIQYLFNVIKLNYGKQSSVALEGTVVFYNC